MPHQSSAVLELRATAILKGQVPWVKYTRQPDWWVLTNQPPHPALREPSGERAMEASMSQQGKAEEWRGTGRSALGIGVHVLFSLVAAAVSDITFAAALEMYRMSSTGKPLRRVNSEV